MEVTQSGNDFSAFSAETKLTVVPIPALIALWTKILAMKLAYWEETTFEILVPG